MPLGPGGYSTVIKSARVTVMSGAGTLAVSFPSGEFARIPGVLVQGSESDSGTYSAASITRSGFTLTVSGSDLADGPVDIVWVALEDKQ